MTDQELKAFAEKVEKKFHRKGGILFQDHIAGGYKLHQADFPAALKIIRDMYRPKTIKEALDPIKGFIHYIPEKPNHKKVEVHKVLRYLNKIYGEAKEQIKEQGEG